MRSPASLARRAGRVANSGVAAIALATIAIALERGHRDARVAGVAGAEPTTMAAAWEGWYAAAVVVGMFVALLRNVAGPDVLMLGALSAVLAAGCVDLESGLRGFSNKGLLTVACLFVVASGISNTGALDYYMSKTLGTPRTAAAAQARLMVPIAAVSAFLNNTPVVAIMIPIVQKWSRKCKIAPAQLFIPLSFASILGGTCTLIGTSTNLVIDGMRKEKYPNERALGMFELSKYGVPVLLSGLAYVLFAAPFLLPGGSRGADADQNKDMDMDNLTVGAVVPRGSPVVDVEVAVLRGLNGLYLVSVQRGDMLMRAVRPEFILEVGDILIFTGLVDRIGDVCKQHGLVPLTHDVEERMIERQRVSFEEDATNRLTNAAHVDGNVTYPPRAKSWQTGSNRTQDDNDISGVAWMHRSVSERPDGRASIDLHTYEKMLRQFTMRTSTDADDAPRGISSTEKRPSLRVSLDHNFVHGESGRTPLDDDSRHDYLDEHADEAERVEVVRARVLENSSLVGTTPAECKFRHKFMASIVAVQSTVQAGTSKVGELRGGHLGKTIFQPNDILMLHVSQESPLLIQKREREAHASSISKKGIPRVSSRKNMSMDDLETLSFTCGDDLEVLLTENKTEVNFNEFAIPMRVVSGGALDGKTIQQVDLANMPGLFCTAVQTHERHEMQVPDGNTRLNGEDILWFAGDMAGIQTLRRIPGLVPQEKQVEKLKHVRKSDRRLVQAVISQGSSLCGKSVRDTHFRTRYDAVIIAVQRSGGRIQARIGDIILEAGDVLLLDTSTSFLHDHKSDPSFALISEIEDSAPPQFDKLLPSCGTAVVMIAVFVAGALDLFIAALLASGIMLATGCLTQEQARASVKWDVIVTIAAAFGLSAALEQTGVASAIASTLVSAGNGLGTGKPGILTGVYLATVLLCNIVGNNAAAALMYPIAAGAADKQGIANVQMSFLLMLASSASFMSPFGYQTNLMVYGPGGYVFANFLKFGAPMQVVQMIVSISVVLLDDSWWIGWIVGFGAVGSIYLGRILAHRLRKRAAANSESVSASVEKLDAIEENL